MLDAISDQAPAQEVVRVVCIKLNGQALVLPVADFAAWAEAESPEGCTYSLTIKDMPIREYQAMDEFGGF